MDNPQIDILINSAGIYLEQGLDEEALKIYLSLTTLFPDRLDFRIAKAMVLNRLNRLKDAFSDLNFVIDEEPEYIEAYFLRGLAYSSVGNYFSAVDDLNRAIEKDPDYIEAYYARALAHLGLNRSGKATADLTRCIESDPNNPGLYMLRGQTYMGMNLIDRAIVDFCNVLELEPSNAEAYINRAMAVESTGDYNTSLIDYQLAVEAAPANPLYRIALATALIRKSRGDEALGHLKTAVSLDPGGSAPWQAIPMMADLEPPVNLLEPIINLAISNQASSIRFEKTGGRLMISIEVLTLKMPLLSSGGHHILSIYQKFADVCGVDIAASKGNFQYAFAKNRYTLEMARSREGEFEQLTVRILYKSFMDKFGFHFENGFIDGNK